MNLKLKSIHCQTCNTFQKVETVKHLLHCNVVISIPPQLKDTDVTKWFGVSDFIYLIFLQSSLDVQQFSKSRQILYSLTSNIREKKKILFGCCPNLFLFGVVILIILYYIQYLHNTVSFKIFLIFFLINCKLVLFETFHCAFQAGEGLICT